MRDPHDRLISTAVLEQSLFEVKRVVVGQDLMVERMHGRSARQRSRAARRSARGGQDAGGEARWPTWSAGRSPGCSSPPT